MFEIAPDVDPAAFAHEHLLPEVADAWVATLWRTIRLDRATDIAGKVVGQ